MNKRRPDSDLLEAWRGGDHDAGDELVRRHFASLARFFKGKLIEGTEDLIQQTFLACVERVDQLNDHSSFRAYMFAVARNLLMQQYRNHYRQAKREAKGVAHLTVEQMVGPSRVVAAREDAQLLVAALRRIPLDFQLALELFYWERLSLVEIAGALDIAVGTVKSRLHRGRTLLREQIEKFVAAGELPESSLDDIDAWAESLRGSVLGDEPDSEPVPE